MYTLLLAYFICPRMDEVLLFFNTKPEGDDRMVKEIVLNHTPINIDSYTEEMVEALHKISVTFKVTNENYHDITTLLYQGTFNVEVPERELSFKGSIQQYYTSISNLYEKGNVGEFQLSLLEKKEGEV